MQIQPKGSVSLLAGIQPKIRYVVLKETALHGQTKRFRMYLRVSNKFCNKKLM